MSYGKNMILLTTYWGDNKTFKMMPVLTDCPYTEVIYDPNTDMLVVITKNAKHNLQMVPKLDDNGNPAAATKPRSNGKAYKEKQIAIEVLQEFYLIEREEMETFIKAFALNAKEFDYAEFYKSLEEELAKKIITGPEAAPLVDEHGKPLPKPKLVKK